MKIRRILFSLAAACLFSAAMVCGAFATPAFAQNAAAERYFQKYLAANPEVARNPSLMSNPRWLNAHPAFHKFLEEHPDIANQAHNMAGRGAHGGYGAYDQKHQWHDSNWWTANNPTWTQQHHPEWMHHPAPAPGYAVHPAPAPGYAVHPAPAPGNEAHHEHEHGNEAHHEHEHDY